MDEQAYAAEAAIEDHHWWFVQRRKLFSSIIESSHVTRNAKVIDIGTGTGANLRLLRDMGFSDVTGIDPSQEAARWCAQKGLGQVQTGDIRQIPLHDESVDFVMATDVVEHVDEDSKAIAEIARILKPGGRALFTVPAFNSLWGLQDEKSHHFRRYRKTSFISLLRCSGFEIKQSFYFNYLLFVPIFIARQGIKLFKLKLDSENQLNSPMTNRVLNTIFAIDIKTAPYLNPPFGVSILVFTQKMRESANA